MNETQGQQHEAWTVVQAALADAKGMHFDDCHKIYITLDDAAEADDWGTYLHHAPDYEMLREWYDGAWCGLQFVTTYAHPSGESIYEHLIPQFFGVSDNQEDPEVQE